MLVVEKAACCGNIHFSCMFNSLFILEVGDSLQPKVGPQALSSSWS